jgi:hypothetical protein
MYDKALMNAIIHNNYVPGLKAIRIACDKCGWEYFKVPYERHDYFEAAKGRSSMYLCQCPKCGGIELNCCAVYYLPDVFPETILVAIGHFISLMVLMKGWMKEFGDDTG